MWKKLYNDLFRAKSLSTLNPPPYQLVFLSLTFGLLFGGRVSFGSNFFAKPPPLPVEEVYNSASNRDKFLLADVTHNPLRAPKG